MRIGSLIIAIVLVSLAIVGWSYVPLIVSAKGAESQTYFRMICSNGPAVGMTKLKTFVHYDSGFRVTYMDGTRFYYSAGNACIIDIDTVYKEEE